MTPQNAQTPLHLELLHFKWPHIWRDFDPASGNYPSLGLAVLVIIPALVRWLRQGGA